MSTSLMSQYPQIQLLLLAGADGHDLVDSDKSFEDYTRVCEDALSAYCYSQSCLASLEYWLTDNSKYIGLARNGEEGGAQGRMMRASCPTAGPDNFPLCDILNVVRETFTRCAEGQTNALSLNHDIDGGGKCSVVVIVPAPVESLDKYLYHIAIGNNFELDAEAHSVMTFCAECQTRTIDEDGIYITFHQKNLADVKLTSKLYIPNLEITGTVDQIETLDYKPGEYYDLHISRYLKDTPSVQ